MGATFSLKKFSLSNCWLLKAIFILFPARNNVAQKALYYLCAISHQEKTWCSADALYTSTITWLLVQACSLLSCTCRSRCKVYVLCLSIVSAAYQSECPLSCDDVTSNLPGTLYLKKICEKVARGGGRINGGGVVITF